MEQNVQFFSGAIGRISAYTLSTVDKVLYKTNLQVFERVVETPNNEIQMYGQYISTICLIRNSSLLRAQHNPWSGITYIMIEPPKKWFCSKNPKVFDAWYTYMSRRCNWSACIYFNERPWIVPTVRRLDSTYPYLKYKKHKIRNNQLFYQLMTST
jgi:hypothetical protein